MRRLDLLWAALHDGGVLDPVAEMVKLGEEKLVALIRKLREGRREEGEGEGGERRASLNHAGGGARHRGAGWRHGGMARRAPTVATGKTPLLRITPWQLLV